MDCRLRNNVRRWMITRQSDIFQINFAIYKFLINCVFIESHFLNKNFTIFINLQILSFRSTLIGFITIVAFMTPSHAGTIIRTQLTRPERSFGHLSPSDHFELWTESNLNILYPPQFDYFRNFLNQDRNYGGSLENNSIGKFLLLKM